MHSDSETTRLVVVRDTKDYQLVQDQRPFVDLETGLTCMVWAMQGHWNGYVQVPVGHIMHGKTYHECVKPDCKDKGDEPMLSSLDGSPFDGCSHTPERMLDVHGGITFSGHLRGQPSDEWWLGFDTNHYMDMEYPKSKEYVIAETLDLAKQLV